MCKAFRYVMAAFAAAFCLAGLAGGAFAATPVGLTVIASPNSIAYGGRVFVSANLSIFNGRPNATGTITFSDAGTVLSTVQVSNNSAVLSTTSLAAGGHTIAARYSGDSNYSPVSDSAVVIVGQTRASLSASSSSITIGQSVTFTATVTATLGGGMRRA